MTSVSLSAKNNEKFLRAFRRPLIRNAWYCAGWAHELDERPLARRILNEPLLFYRTTAGRAVALLDICPHKLAPMSLGRRVGDNLECGYHGLLFDENGSCVHNPQGNGIIPPNARLRSFPLEERYGALWIWMGDATRADPATIADFSHIDDPARRTVRGGHHVRSNYMMMIENLMDLGHVLYLHAQTAGAADARLADSRIIHDGNSISDQRLYADMAPPGIFAPHARHMNRVDFWTDITWHAPSLIRNYTGVAPTGHARGPDSVDLYGSHFLTPETEHSTHYFYCHTRNHDQDNPQADEFYHNWQRKALKAEDSMVAEAIEDMVAEIDSHEVEMIVLSTDISGIRVNRILDEMAAAETAG
jgi:vanillate O-demethylase monooxygenase subunit